MYKAGDTVMHPTSGVCRVESIKEESFGGVEKKKYYILKTVYDSSSTVIYVPVDGERVKLRKLLSREDIKEIIHSVSVKVPLWVDNNAQRKEIFKNIMHEGDYAKILQMICEIHLKQAERTDSGKKMYVSDSKILTAAEKIIHQEFAHTLNIEPERVADFIVNELNIG